VSLSITFKGPQIYKMIKNHSAKSVSFTSTTLDVGGLFITLVNFIMFERIL